MADAETYEGFHGVPRRLQDDETRLRTTAIVSSGLAAVAGAPDDRARADALARLVLLVFNDYYARSRRIPWLAKQAFEARDWARSVELSRIRIAIFGDAIRTAAPSLAPIMREAAARAPGFWAIVEARFRALLGERYERDLALAFLNALRRRVYQDEWVPVGYEGPPEPRATPPDFVEMLETGPTVTPETVRTILDLPGIDAPWRTPDQDAARVAARINAELDLGGPARLDWIAMIRAGFYRNRGAYIVGLMRLERDGVREERPLALALLHDADGVHVDAVLTRETTLRHVFSSTLANFHVTVTAYHELVDVLQRLMPARPHGMHYSTVGYNHVGKLAVMRQVAEELARADERMDFAPGPRGSVSIAFTAPNMRYVLKVVRDTPTENYKWERWDGTGAVLDKYRRVHRINRSGSMLDNIIWTNATLPRALFVPELVDELLEAAGGSVGLYRDQLLFRHLIAQSKVTPLPLYLADCSPQAAEMAVIRLGQCIRNNASTNVFNRDLDGRNYGISALGFCYLFDYDAVEPLTEIKVRTNLDRIDGEEDIPDWFFEEGPVFLPEELEAHLRLPDRHLRRLFREAHGELLGPAWWERMQARLRAGAVPRVRTYPRSTQLGPSDR